jgi:hypothetical protein
MAARCAISLTVMIPGMAGCLPFDLFTNPPSTEQVQGYNPGPPPSEPTASTTPDAVDSDSSPTTSTDTITFDTTAPTQHVEREPNDTFDQAEPVPCNGQVELVGTTAANLMDVDLFDIGPGQAGQRLQADLNAGGADIQLGVLDGNQQILAYLDPLSPTAGPNRVDIILAAATDHIHVMVATRNAIAADRDYRASISLGAGLTVPTSRPQAVVLVFGGAAQVKIGSRPPVDVPKFDIANVNPEFAGQTEVAIQLLLQKVRDDYAGLNVTFYRDTDTNRPADDCTSIYFGNADTRLLGLADNIDPFNGTPEQSAIIYTDTFSLFNQLHPGFDATIQVLANVASHETGHLLGLRHTAAPHDLMDVTASARQMLADQYFSLAELHGSVLPFGFQNAPAMLSWSVGGQLQPQPELKVHAEARLLTGGPDFYIPRSLLADCGCPDCDRK